MATEWRNGQLMDDDELEMLYQFSEMQRPGIFPTRKDAFWNVLLLGLACGALWALGTLVYYELFRRIQ